MAAGGYFNGGKGGGEVEGEGVLIRGGKEEKEVSLNHRVAPK